MILYLILVLSLKGSGGREHINLCFQSPFACGNVQQFKKASQPITRHCSLDFAADLQSGFHFQEGAFVG